MERMTGRLLATGRSAGFDVDSAGTHGPAGLPIHPLTAAALARRGVPAEGHASRLLTPDVVAWADLVLTAERAHRAAVVAALPEAADRTFTLLEFAHRAGRAVDLGATDPADLVAGVDALGREDSARGTRSDDVPDPVSGDENGHESVAEVIRQAVVMTADALLSTDQRDLRGGPDGSGEE